MRIIDYDIRLCHSHVQKRLIKSVRQAIAHKGPRTE